MHFAQYLRTIGLALAIFFMNFSLWAADSTRVPAEELKKASRSAQKNAHSLVEAMTLREKIGQLMMLDMRVWQSGTNSQEQPVTKMIKEHGRLIRDYGIGSVIFFRQNLVDSKQVIKLVGDLQDQSPRLPMFFTVDQEGGYITRLQVGTNFSGNMALAATRSTSLAKKVGQVHGLELSALGINVNFSPVIDVNSNQNNPVIGVRSYSDNLDLVIRMAESYIDGLERFPVMATVKHFPGHGNVSIDSHEGMPIANDTEKDWRRIHLKPFTHAVKSGIRSVMTGHVAIPSLDNEMILSKTGQMVHTPATLSTPILTGILRNELKFKGLIFTDALDMGAISENFTAFDAAKRAILAGVDILTMPILVRNVMDVYRFEEFFQQLEVAAQHDEVLAQRITESATRIVTEKLNMALSWNKPSVNYAKEIIASKEHKELEQYIAKNAITLLENNNVLPFELKKKQQVLVLNSSDIRNEIIKDEIRNIVDETKDISIVVVAQTVEFTQNITPSVRTAIEDSDLIVMCTENLSKKSILAQQIIDTSQELGKKLVVIATLNPYDIAYLENVDAYMVTYGMAPYVSDSSAKNGVGVNIRAAVRTIFSHPRYTKVFNKPRGQLPVNVLSPGMDDLLYPYGHGLRY